MKEKKESRCPICRTILNTDTEEVCPQCGMIHIVSERVGIIDREQKKVIANYQKVFYVADNLFAYDKMEQSSGAIQGGVRAGLAHAGPVGWVAGAVINTAIDAAQNKARESKEAKKVVSTAVCYDWGSVASIRYPIEPFKIKLANIKAGNGIDIKLKNGTEFTLVVSGMWGWENDTAKELYEKMNELFQKSIARNPINPVSPVNPVNQASPVKMSYDGAVPVFFKCAYCGVTQMQEGNFCAYCGKPAPSSEPVKQEAVAKKNEIICPHCGNKQDAGGKFCFQCGQRLIPEPAMERKCPYCGAKVKDGMLFCMECGTKV